jgi:hypothetical protein
MMKKHNLPVTVKNAGGGGAFEEVPDDVEKASGSKQSKVKASLTAARWYGWGQNAIQG